MNILRYKIVLYAEDGQYNLEDGFLTMESALTRLNKLSLNYGEGQELQVIPYCVY